MFPTRSNPPTKKNKKKGNTVRNGQAAFQVTRAIEHRKRVRQDICGSRIKIQDDILKVAKASVIERRAVTPSKKFAVTVTLLSSKCPGLASSGAKK